MGLLPAFLIDVVSGATGPYEGATRDADGTSHNPARAGTGVSVGGALRRQGDFYPAGSTVEP
ncbi:hypothetical protein GJ633_11825 [Halorubrum sp. CBA1125]|uniref:hypothetical protein n=1 Tax=Halorubrum sp. CBA1125 TaxID=2668072 RepID=UPI0012E8A88C|nr:hypothetical protein [Halorubrum sp. CBA1125]MUW15260.1 hypothetical protein [Halorubrum sp. CBA1125]